MNIKHIIGEEPAPERLISDMVQGESGYTVPWAYQDGQLDTNFPIGEKGGTASLWVECQEDGQYILEFEEPKYRGLLDAL